MKAQGWRALALWFCNALNLRVWEKMIHMLRLNNASQSLNSKKNQALKSFVVIHIARNMIKTRVKFIYKETIVSGILRIERIASSPVDIKTGFDSIKKSCNFVLCICAWSCFDPPTIINRTPQKADRRTPSWFSVTLSLRKMWASPNVRRGDI